MSINHRAEAERAISVAPHADNSTAIATIATAHALLAIHDLLAKRLPSPLDGFAATEDPAATEAARCGCGRAVPCRHCGEPTCGAKYDRCPECAADDAYEKGRKDAACDRVHADEWVEVDEATWADMPVGTRTRREWVVGTYDVRRCFIHRDDLPDPDADLVERMAQAIHAEPEMPGVTAWEDLPEYGRDALRKAARAALAVVRTAEGAGR